jgi:NhaP-type Na+/H+ and K+/H+ antiporter
VRPAIVLPARGGWFVALAGLKGAVPMLLALFAVRDGVGDGLYGVVFAAVVFNVLAVGGLLRLDVATER